GLYLFNKLIAERRFKTLAAFFPVLLLILFSRPVGLIFLIAMMLVILCWMYKTRRKKLFYFYLLLCVIAFMGVANSPATAFINPDSVKRMEVICQVPTGNGDTSYQEFNRSGLGKV